MKKFFILLYFVLISGFAASAENYISESFYDYGIKSIGIFTETYNDIRSDNFVFEVAAIRANGILQDARYFRYRYCNYALVTPPLTSPEYPLHSDGSDTAELITAETQEFLSNLGWQAEKYEGFTEGNLTDVLQSAEEQNLDAVLIIRCTPLTYILPIENYIERSGAEKSTADLGKIRKGRGFIPSVELYDTESGERIWYSAYHTGHSLSSKRDSFENYVKAAEAFFIDSDEKLEMKAAERMISLTLANEEAPFPAAASAPVRKEGTGADSDINRLLWTDIPSYKLYGGLIGIGYRFDYIGSYDILYKDSYNENYPGETPTETVGTAVNSIMHSIRLPFLSLTASNLSIEPALSFSVLPPVSAAVAYTDIRDDYHGGYREVSKTDTAVMSATSIGTSLSLKYLVRPADKFAFYIGTRGSINFWWHNFQLYNNPDDFDGFSGNPTGLYGFSFDDADLLLNASLIAGVKWESNFPIELFIEVTPVGPGSSIMFSAGAAIVPFTWGYTDPHAANVASGTNGF